MGNVAHDLKTPLHSIMAEIDFLKQTLEQAYETVVSNNMNGTQEYASPPMLLQAASAHKVQTTGADTAVSTPVPANAPASVPATEAAPMSVNTADTLKNLLEATGESFESLDTTCKFLVMAINRSQDYVKASSNIALTPILDTFNVNEVLNVVYKCMANQKCGRIITIHPLVSYVDN
jgi:signal transduction histidine kinase